jgi:hypothetical protein
MDLFKDCIPSILDTKKYQLHSNIEENEYVPFVVNRALSYHIDCILFAQDLNFYKNLDKKLQYDYLFYSIKPYKRPFRKWIKSGSSYDDIKLIQEYFNYSFKKAKEVSNLISEDQLNHIRKVLDKSSVVKI